MMHTTRPLGRSRLASRFLVITAALFGLMLATAAASAVPPTYAESLLKYNDIVNGVPGSALDVSGDGVVAVVGASEQSFLRNGTTVWGGGVVHIFDRSGDHQWVETSFNSPTAQVDDGNGWSVAIDADGDRIAVGALRTAYDGLSVLSRDGSAWTETVLATGLTGQNGSGTGDNVDISGDGSRIVSGSSASTVNGWAYHGEVVIFDDNDGSWSYQLLPFSMSQGDYRFGEDVAISEDGRRIAVGAPGDDTSGTSAGAVWIFDDTGGGWTSTKVSAPDGGSQLERFGTRVAISDDGEVLAVGAITQNSDLSDGSVYIYQLSTSSTAAVQLTEPDAVPGDRYGYQSLALDADGDVLLVGDMFDRTVWMAENAAGGWAQTAHTGLDDRYGHDVAVNDDASVVLVNAYDVEGGSSGNSYSWTQPLPPPSPCLGATITGSPGNDTITGTSGDDIIDGGAGDDIIDGGAGDDIICGGTGNDTLFGGRNDDQLHGELGDDLIHGENGNDVIRGGVGADELHGGGGLDYLRGEGGNDTIYGDRGNDQIRGGDDDDLLYGGGNNDTIYGDAGHDVADGGKGKDLCILVEQRTSC